jgi:hypothetical protein
MSIENPPRAAAHPIEYLMVEMPVGTLDDKRIFLNELGADGWQLVQFGGLTVEGTHYVIFMRLI